MPAYSPQSHKIVMGAEGGWNYSLKKKKKNTAAPYLVKSQWLAAIQSHRGECWPGKWGGREEPREGGSVVLVSLAQPAGKQALCHWEVSGVGVRGLPALMWPRDHSRPPLLLLPECRRPMRPSSREAEARVEPCWVHPACPLTKACLGCRPRKGPKVEMGWKWFPLGPRPLTFGAGIFLFPWVIELVSEARLYLTQHFSDSKRKSPPPPHIESPKLWKATEVFMLFQKYECQDW